MSEKLYPVPAEWAKRAWVDDAKYQELYERSVKDPDGFWGEMGRRLDWIKPYTKVKNTSFDGDTSRSNGSRTARSTSAPTASTATSRPAAIRSRSSGRATTRPKTSKITYRQLHEQVCRLANVLKSRASRRAIGSPSTCR